MNKNYENIKLFRKKNTTKNDTKGKVGTMQTIFKKNQLVILSLALMLITAGYMNYTNNENELNISLAELGDAKLVGTNVYDGQDNANDMQTSENNVNEISNVTASNAVVNEISNAPASNAVVSEVSNVPQNNEVVNETIETNNGIEKNENITNNNNQIETSNNVDSKDYFAQTRLDRETMYSQMLETYQKILENEKVPSDQKSIASNEIKNINDRKSAIAIAENIIKTKDFEDVVILINDNSINVVVKQKENLTTEQVAQISNIVSRELKAEIGDIHITTHK